jgi:hypothetical protein
MKPRHEGKSRSEIAYPGTDIDKARRALQPFLCLSFKTGPPAMRQCDMSARAEPCVNLCYVSERKSFALLTLPDLHLTYSVEVKFVPDTFPLRALDPPSMRLSDALTPRAEAALRIIHGPNGIMANQALGDGRGLESPLEPRRSSSRGYTPSLEALESVAAGPAHPPVHVMSVATSVKYSPDQLAARVPHNIGQALSGDDAEYWIHNAVKRDFAVLRKNGCFGPATLDKPPRPVPVEQRFRNKYSEEQPIALCDIPLGDFKGRSVVRGDRFRFGEHYDVTSGRLPC